MFMNNLYDRLKSYSKSGICPMHMPGHKRNPSFCMEGFDIDITEINGFDNLHNPTGIIKKLEEDAACLWKASSSIISVNGATAPIISSVMVASSLGKILVASNCHISTWHALELSNCEFDVINPIANSMPFCLEINPDDIYRRLSNDPTIKSVIITSPTYEGVVSDVARIYSICQSLGVALIVDEAHGAHFGLDDFFPLTSKADIVIKSIHKTLHAPTGTAILLSYSDKIPLKAIRHYMDIVETSSPSYVLMAGISRVVNDLKTPDLTQEWVQALQNCRELLNSKLKHLKLYSCNNYDPSKLVILCSGVIDGEELSILLRERQIEIEASFSTHIIAMTGIGDTKSSLGRFTDALLEIDSKLEGSVSISSRNMVPTDKIEMIMPINSAALALSISVSKENAIGKISSNYAYHYPPGIPILIPGQKITKERVDCLSCNSFEVVKD